MGLSRREIEAKVGDRAADVAGALGCELVEVEYVKEHGDYFLRVFIDKAEGVGLDDCQAVSVRLGNWLDDTDPIPGRYSLEVSSPGLDRPLKSPADYIRFKDNEIKIKTYAPVNGRKNWQGVLLGLEDGEVWLDTDGEKVSLPYDMIARANLVPQL